MMLIFYLSLALLIAIMVYLFVLRPWQLTWGATKTEVTAALIGDEIVRKPHFVATRAITIAAPPAEVWKWIIQIGSAPGAGFYARRLGEAPGWSPDCERNTISAFPGSSTICCMTSATSS